MPPRLRYLLKGKLWLQIVLGLVLGLGLGLAIGPDTQWLDDDTRNTVVDWLVLPGNLFLDLVKMIMIPLILSSIILGLLSVESGEQLKKMGLGVLAFFVITTALAISMGIGLTNLLQPGAGLDLAGADESISAGDMESLVPQATNIPGFISGLLPTNPLGDLAAGNMLAVVIMAVVFGIALLNLRQEAHFGLVNNLLTAVQNVSMTIVGWAMRLAPLAVFGFMVKLGAQQGVSALQGLGLYVGTVTLGLVAMLLVYLVLIGVLGRYNPLLFMRHMREVQLLAFSTASSAAAMPLSLRTAEERLKLNPGVSNFVIPVGATVNMAGTALYQGVAAITVAQAYGLELSVATLLQIVVTVVLASVGTPAAPGVGFVVLITVLKSAGIPPEGLGILLGVDRILDMMRTTLNVTGDLAASTIFSRLLPWDRSADLAPASAETAEATSATT